MPSTFPASKKPLINAFRKADMTIHTLIPPLSVAIIGAGPGGLATAIALDNVPNVQVTIYEQANILREVGAGISVGQNTWNVLELLGVSRSLNSGHITSAVINFDGRTGEELHRREGIVDERDPALRTQRTKLQLALLAHTRSHLIQLSKKLVKMVDKAESGVELHFKDGTIRTADLVVGADGIRSVVRDFAWPDYKIKFTGTTIWRAVLPWDKVQTLDSRFGTTAWWHGPSTHVYLSPVGEGLGEVAARSWQEPSGNVTGKVSWGVPVGNKYVESHFMDYLPQIKQILSMVPEGGWREFAAFAGPELSQLTAWDNKIVLVGDSSHALSGAFGAGAGFAMEDGWVLAQALRFFRNDVSKALPLFDAIRMPYYSRMYAHLACEGTRRSELLQRLQPPNDDERVKAKIITGGGTEMDWIYKNHIGEEWRKVIEELDHQETELAST